MPTTIQKYCCSICGNEYSDYTSASMCEAIGSPLDAGIMPGQVIAFENEEGGVRWSYSTLYGTVLLKYVSQNTNQFGKTHVWTYVVKNERYPWEYAVANVETDSGTQLISKAEWKFNAGFAESFRCLPGQKYYQGDSCLSN